MEFFEWKDQYSLGIKLIDDQHKSLIKLINDLHRGLIGGTTNEIIEETLSSLIDYTIYHFNSEEEIFRMFNYPEYHAHKKQHDALAQRVLEIQKSISDKSATLSFEVMDFLVDWLTDHILTEDQNYKSYFNAKNIILEGSFPGRIGGNVNYSGK